GLGKAYSVRQVHREVEIVTGRTVPLRVAGRRPGDPSVLCASPRRIMEDLGWNPEHSSLHEIVESAWLWKQKQLERSIAAAPAINRQSIL
ncbi:MAG TPA: hypothetical protein VFY05_08250, partial [Candidatus Angelobacter sp.]|nr:hypothetical protein [Candidatus Angelobacter sp.]